jgi:hypothetical protein
LSLINILAAAVEKLLWPEPSNAELWAMVGINWVIAIVAVVAFSNVIAQRRGVPVHTVRAADRPLGMEVR